MSIPSIVELAGVFENPGNALRYLVLHGVIEVPENCSRPACLGQMRVCNLLKPYLYRCTRKRTCGMSLSVYKDSFFGSTHLPANKVLLIAYLWLTKTLNTAMITQVGVGSATITNWANHLRCLVTWDELECIPIPSKVHGTVWRYTSAVSNSSVSSSMERWWNLFGGAAMQMTFGIDYCMQCSMWYMMLMLKMLRILMLITIFDFLQKK